MYQTIFILFITVQPQLGYDLSRDTVEAYRSLMMNISATPEISQISSFKEILSGSQNSATLEVNPTSTDWDEYRSLVQSVTRDHHDRLAKKCKEYMNSEVSQTSSDRKFWQNLYAIHFSYTK